jgi:hypothetical protein
MSESTAVDSRPARPVKPVSKFDPNVMHTPRDYANHLNLMLDYYVDLSKWLESSLTASEQRVKELERQIDHLCDRETK